MRSPSRKDKSPDVWLSKSYIAVTYSDWNDPIFFGGGGGGFFFPAAGFGEYPGNEVAELLDGILEK